MWSIISQMVKLIEVMIVHLLKQKAIGTMKQRMMNFQMTPLTYYSVFPVKMRWNISTNVAGRSEGSVRTMLTIAE